MSSPVHHCRPELLTFPESLADHEFSLLQPGPSLRMNGVNDNLIRVGLRLPGKWSLQSRCGEDGVRCGGEAGS